ncbi:transposase [Proteiniphilum propionicum]|uniref:transposase n=1 Tax=Proteiniphilum propionicum TaxID=2829812 RepID=UPI001EECE1B0|nr:transposase [Proteiniphilum propionicum]ULB33405.1 transposase [Proteiniphilum propionicum]
MDQMQAVELLIQSQAEQIRQLTEANAKLSGQLTGMQQRMDKLLAQIAWFTRQFYGRKSEKLSQLDPGQLSLFETNIRYANPHPMDCQYCGSGKR